MKGSSMPKNLETLLLTDGLMSNALDDFARLAEILIPLIARIDDDGSDVNIWGLQDELERAADIIVKWCA